MDHSFLRILISYQMLKGSENSVHRLGGEITEVHMRSLGVHWRSGKMVTNMMTNIELKEKVKLINMKYIILTVIQVVTLSVHMIYTLRSPS